MAGEKLIPRFHWAARYTRGDVIGDIIAGLVLSVLLVPQAMAYAQLAGLPPETGLFAALAPPLLYLLFGTSRFVSMGPVALVSLVVGEAAVNAPGGPSLAASIIAIEAGLLLCILGGLGMGRLVNFISEPVLLGFTAAAAVLIATSQLPTLLGLDTARAGDLPSALQALAAGLPGWQAATTLIGLAAVLLFVIINRYAAALLWKAGVHPPARQAIAKALPLLVVVAAAFAAAASPQAVVTIGAIDAGLPGLPDLFVGISLWLQLLPSGIAVAIIVFVTATAVAKSLAGSDRRHLDTSREAVALGAGNIAAALMGGYAVGASLSRSALVEDSGAKSPIATVVASLVVLAVLLLLAPLIAYLPRTALAALVISAVFGLVRWNAIRFVWRHDRIEGAIVALAFLATLVFGVRIGLAAGAAIGLAHFLWFSSVPRVTRVGSAGGGSSYRSIECADVDIVTTLPILVLRIDRSIYFGNASFCENRVFERLSEHEEVNCLVLDMSAVNGVDASGVQMLQRLTERLHEMDITVRFASVHEPVAREMASLNSRICHYHPTIDDALSHCGVVSGTEPIAPT